MIKATLHRYAYVWLQYSLFLLLCVITQSAALGTFPKGQHPVDRATVLHYKSTKFYIKGNTSKAIRYLNRAIKLHRCNRYIYDLAMIHHNNGDYRKAHNLATMITMEPDATPFDKVKLKAWTAKLAAEYGLRYRVMPGFKEALYLMDMHSVDSLKLKSMILTSLGTARIFNQSSKNLDKPAPTHRRDFEQSLTMYDEAIELDSTNCAALYCKMIVERILSIEKEYWKYGYVPYDLIGQLEIPSIEGFCAPPPPPPLHANITETLSNTGGELIFMVDISGSMKNACPSGASRIDASKDILGKLIGDVDSDIPIGLVTFGGGCQTPKHDFAPGELSRNDLTHRINNLSVAGATPLNIALRTAASKFSSDAASRAIFLLTDGLDTCYEESTCELAGQLRISGIKVHAFAPILAESNTEVLAIANCLAAITGGELLEITEKAVVKVVEQPRIPQYMQPLMLRQEDLVKATYTPVSPLSEEIKELLNTPKNTQ